MHTFILRKNSGGTHWIYEIDKPNFNDSNIIIRGVTIQDIVNIFVEAGQKLVSKALEKQAIELILEEEERLLKERTKEQRMIEFTNKIVAVSQMWGK